MSPNDEGQYPLYLTQDASGKALPVHIDFLVVGEGRYQLEVNKWPPTKKVTPIWTKHAPANRWR